MKILELRFKNLNSLYGEWLIDFTTAEYTSNGIFALTGPTGAGKSTILDAICLALYGATPRLGKITKSGNEIMSRQTGECFAEVTFESQSGVFKCHWSQHRARKKPDGKLADSKHEIADANSGQILESKKREVAIVIEEKTGMDFDRFTRSILLAQGGFDTFLKADVEQKSKVLEQITGTEIYSQISIRVHERHKDERTELNRLEAEISGIAILTEEQEAEISQALNEKQKLEIAASGKVEKTKKSIDWLKVISNLNNDITSFSEQDEKINIMLADFKAEREKLHRAQKTAEFDGEYANLSAVRKQQGDEQNTLKQENSQLPETEIRVKEKDHHLKTSEQITLNAKIEQKSQAPLIQQIRVLDQQLLDRKKLIDSEETEIKKFSHQISNDKKLRNQSKNKLTTAENDLQQINHYLTNNVCDESLITQFAAIEEQLQNLHSIQNDIVDNTAVLEANKKKLKSAEKKFKAHNNDLTQTKEKLKQAQKQLIQKKNELSDYLEGRLLREYRSEKDNLLREMGFLKKIESLKSERNKLEDHKPCPLCGSKKHPYAQGNIPDMDETDKKIDVITQRIKHAEQLEQAITDRETQEKQASEQLIDTEKQQSKAANNKDNAEQAVTDITRELTKNIKRFNDLKKTILIKLQPLGIKEVPDSDVSLLLSSLKTRLSRWQEQQQKNNEIVKTISELNGELKKLNAVIESHTKIQDKKNIDLSLLIKEYKLQEQKRNDVFADKDPDIEQARLEKMITTAEYEEKTARTERDKIKTLLDSAKVRISTLTTRIDKRKTELQILTSEFIKTLQLAGFSDETSFIANRLSIEEREQLTGRANELDNKKTELQVNIKDREIRLTEQKGKKITELTLDDLQPDYENLVESLKQMISDIAGCKHQLTENEAAKNKIKAKQGMIDAQKNECRKWEKLHLLIGSADGKRFRNFAQGLTFELMVSHANRQLEKMTDRYLLIRDDKQPLELNVVDNYQAGEIRSTKNLSGGESFIVSLTLALGLSKMASHKVRVDSLFLDEGFGTLDEEALDTALETLSGLQQDGKLIGIISHVSALKERISTQINIYPVAGGKSSVSGPGCRKNNNVN